MIKKLSALRSGESGTIASIELSDLHIKLMEMGCIPGENIKVQQVAPFGDPITVKVAGYHLSLRLSEASQILVDTEN